MWNTRMHRAAGAVLSTVLMVAVVACGLAGPLGGKSPCGEFELVSAGEAEDLLGAPVVMTEPGRDSGSCAYLLGSGDVLRVHLPNAYVARDSAGLRGLDLGALAAGASVSSPDGAGRASYASTSRGESLIASYGEMQVILALRTAPSGGTPSVPDGARGGMVRLAGELIARLTPDLYAGRPSSPRYPDTDLSSPSRDVCPELITVAQVEERMGRLVANSERASGSDVSCSFSVDEPFTTTVGVRVIDRTGELPAADVAALRQIDLDAAPVQVRGEVGGDFPPRYGSVYEVRVDGSGLPSSNALLARADSVTVMVWYAATRPDEEPAAIEAVRPALQALAEQLIENL